VAGVRAIGSLIAKAALLGLLTVSAGCKPADITFTVER
jgi:hypothetical protein